MERPRDLDSHGVGVQAIGVALAVAAERGNHRHDVVFQQCLQERRVHALDPARQLVIDALQDARRMGHEAVAVRGPQIIGGEPFENLMGDAIGGRQGKLQGGGVGYPCAIDVGRRGARLQGEPPNLLSRPVHQGDANAQAAQEGNVQQEVAEIVIFDHRSIHGNHEHLVAKPRHVAQDLAQDGQA